VPADKANAQNCYSFFGALLRIIANFIFFCKGRKGKSIDVCCQFHQHFTRAFFVWKSFWQLFSSYMKVGKSCTKHFRTKNAHLKCWWNWPQMWWKSVNCIFKSAYYFQGLFNQLQHELNRRALQIKKSIFQKFFTFFAQNFFFTPPFHKISPETRPFFKILNKIENKKMMKIYF